MTRRIIGRRIRAALIVCACLLSEARAADISFSAAVDRDVVGVGERFQLTVTVSGDVSRVPQPELPALDGFENLGSTRSSSTNISLINGRLQQSNTIDFIYILAAKSPGELTIGPCRITIAGTEYTTAPVKVTVTSQPQSRPRPAQPAPLDPFGFFSFPEPGQRRARGSDAAADLTLTVDRTTVYQGEQVTATFTFYTTAEPGQLGIKQSPSFSGFWAENLYEVQQLEYRTRSHKGRSWRAAVVRQVALFPMQAGELKVDKMTLNGALLEPGFFGYNQTPFEASSDPVTITVKPLPAEGRPAGFTGGVGEFEVTAGLSRDTSRGGEPLSLAIRISGTGNIGLISAPELPAIPGVKALAPETRDNLSRKSGRISGTRDFSYPLLPQADGKYLIPELALGFFSPGTGHYYVRTTPRLEFVATGTSAGQSPAASSGVRVLGTDILHIKAAAGPRSGWDGPWWSWLCYPAGLLLLGAGAIVGRHRRRLESDRGYARRSRANRLAKQRLKHAAHLLARRDVAGCYGALSQAVTGFIGDRFNIEATAMTREQLQAELAARGVGGEAVTHLMGLIGQCDLARFAPGQAECDPAELLRRVQQILESL